MSYIPEDDKARKMLPIFDYFTRYFPKAHREVTKVCVVNNVRYNPERAPNDINWARGKSPNQLGSAFRHMAERQIDGKVFEDVPPEVAKLTGIERVYVLAEAMWRIGAQLELDIEQQEAVAPSGTTVPELVAKAVADARLAHGTLTPEQESYALSAAMAYYKRHQHSGPEWRPVVGCECDPCTKARNEAATGV